MAEAPPPPPPPNLNYNTFRTWRKEKGIRSTKEELSAAWKEYSASSEKSKKSPSHANVVVKKPSPKKSPIKNVKKSPVKKLTTKKVPIRFTGTVPGDVLRLIGSRIQESKEVGRMTAAGKKTSEVVHGRLEEICYEEPTELEILSALETLSLPVSFRMTPANNDAIPTHGVLYLFGQEKNGVIVAHTMGSTEEHRKIIPKFAKPVRGFVESFMRSFGKQGKVYIRLSPLTLLDVYKRRGSCQRMDNTYLKLIRQNIERLFFSCAHRIFHSVGIGLEMLADMITGEMEYEKTWYRPYIGEVDRVTHSYSTMAYNIGWLCNSMKLAHILTNLGKGISNLYTAGEFLNACIGNLAEAYKLIYA